MIEPKIFTVGQINRYIRNLLENDFILSSLLVKGEISNFKAHSSGHLYFTLKDASGALSCVMFRQDAAGLPFEPENGMQVVVYGHISLYEKTGQYQLYAEFMEPLGIGALQVAFEQLKEKLAEEGLFDGDFKREIPKNPSCIAVITSPTGAAVRDILQIVKRRDPNVKVAIFPTLVQGEQAAADIVRSLKLVNEWGKADVIILGRGGGSMEDLWCFNDENVARAVFASEIPVISAVGHETDFTITDFVADMRAPTPSAAAELATTPLAERREAFHRLELRLERDVSALLTSCRRRLDLLKSRPVMERPLERIYRTMMDVEETQQRLDKEMTNRLMQRAERWQYLTNRLEAASPLAVMSRGYVMAVTSSGNLLTSVKQAEVGDRVTLHLQDGKIETNIQEKEVFTHGEEESHL
ncbi:exodeoxyribonuclease VII large subunit [Anaerotignum sp.]|uniref:exodeoxyribonuclease VII large subunit n=1 Tax=Anaerotignum sp. TaxID=2039241 RepID=UPI0029D763BA|nr:exodeoxyribonuclease VII large subunit [Anaerotignum sp.]MCI6056041.1 exodeoxyribonuclease VII large subunit [Clostridia bacterium]MDY3597311.1 exodeoxyribonuclease VII large subunit [Anaerotignum sp.]